MAEAQFTPEVARGLVGVAANPEAPIAGTTTADLILKATAERHSTGQSEEALKIIAKEALPHKKEDVDKVVIWNLSSERDATTKAKKTPTDADEIRRVNDSKTEDNAVRNLVENGVIDAGFRDKLTAYLEMNAPMVSDVIQNIRTTGGDVNAFVEGLMKMPGFKSKAMELHTQRLDPNKRLTQETRVQDLQVEIDKLTAKLASQVTQVEIDTARTDLETAETALESHPADLLQYKAKSTRYQELTNEMPEIKKTLKKHEGLGKQFEQQKADLLTERGGLDPVTGATRIAQIDAEIKKIESKPDYANYTNSKNEIAEHVTLETEIAGLQTTLGPLQKDVTKKQEILTALQEKQKTNSSPKEKAAIEAEIDQKKGQLADAKTLLEAEQMKFYREATHIGEDAMKEYLNTTLNGLKSVWKEEATKQAEKDKTEQGKLAASGIDKLSILWKNRVRKGKFDVYVGDKGRIENILKEAFKPGGAENLVVYLESQSNTSLRTAIPELTIEEIKAVKDKLKNDPDFRKTQGEGLAKQALADYLLVGGRLNGDLIKNLSSSEFGRSLLTEARTKADQAIQQYKDQFGKGVLDGGTRFGEFVKKTWWMWGIGVIALILFLVMTRK